MDLIRGRLDMFTNKANRERGARKTVSDLERRAQGFQRDLGKISVWIGMS
jgi:hypothetical protein